MILPAMQRTIERMVWESRNIAEQRIFKFVSNALTEWQKENLDALIDLFEEKDKISPLEWEHINFLGDCRFDTKGVTGLDSLRPLIENNKAIIP